MRDDPAPGWGELARSTHDGRHTASAQPPHQQLTAYTRAYRAAAASQLSYVGGWDPTQQLTVHTRSTSSSRPPYWGCSRQPSTYDGHVRCTTTTTTTKLYGLTSLLLRGDVCARLAGHARRSPHARGGWRVVHAARGERQRHAPDRDQAQAPAQAQAQARAGLRFRIRLGIGLRRRLRLGPGLGLRRRIRFRIRLGLGLDLGLRLGASKVARVLGPSTTASLRRHPAPSATRSGPRAAPPWASTGRRPGLDGQRRGNRRLWGRLARAVGAVARRPGAGPRPGRTELPRAARRAPRRHRSRAGHCQLGHFDHAARPKAENWMAMAVDGRSPNHALQKAMKPTVPAKPWQAPSAACRIVGRRGRDRRGVKVDAHVAEEDEARIE